MGDMKGSALVGSREFIRKEFGEEGLRKVLEALPAGTRELFGGPILQNRWYPTRQLIAFARTADNVLGRGDLALCEGMGRYSAWEQLSFAYKILILALSTDGLFTRIPTMWKTFNKTGRMEVTEIGPHGCVILLHDHEDFDAAYCRRLMGWMAVAGEKTGSRNVRVEHPRCRGLVGGSTCEFRCHWELS